MNYIIGVVSDDEKELKLKEETYNKYYNDFFQNG